MKKLDGSEVRIILQKQKWENASKIAETWMFPRAGSKAPGPNTQIQTGLSTCSSEDHRTCSKYAFSVGRSYYSLFVPEQLRTLYAGLTYVYKFDCEAFLALRAR